MISDAMQDALNKQLNKELYSSYSYLAMAAYFEAESLPGFANWMTVQAREEVDHAMKIYQYLNDVDARVELDAIPKPPSDFGAPLRLVEQILDNEKEVTTAVHNIVGLARKEADYATENFMQWFVMEQVEEEANAKQLIDDLNLVADAPHSLFMMDRQLMQRQYGGGGGGE
jgi:ferritin